MVGCSNMISTSNLQSKGCGNRAQRDPRSHFKDRHAVSFSVPTMASMEPQFHRRYKLNTHTSCACIWLVAARDRHNNTRSISVVPQELIEKGVETKTKSLCAT